MAQLAVVERYEVEEQHQQHEEAERREQAHPNEEDLAVAVVGAERDERQQRVRQQEAETEAEQVGEVVDPRQQAEQEERRRDGQQLDQRLQRMLEHGPAVEHLDDQARQQAELGAGWTDLRSNARRVASRRANLVERPTRTVPTSLQQRPRPAARPRSSSAKH